MPTKSTSASLATSRTTPRTDPRIALRRLRVAFIGMVSGARRMPQGWYELTRTDREVAFPFERERRFIHEAIREGATSPEAIVRWRIAQLLDDLEQFDESPQIDDLSYIALIREQSEAINAQSLAHAEPTDTNLDRAVRETRESVAYMRLFMALASRGRRLLHRPH